MKTNKFNFTKPTIKKLPTPEKGFKTYSDSTEKGLKLYVTSTGSKSFFVRKFVNGKDERIILGSFPVISVEEARSATLQVRAVVSKGINPNEEKHKLQQAITFKELFQTYMERHAKPYKKTWKEDERQFKQFCKQLSYKKAIKISHYEIDNLHKDIAKKSGIYSANRFLALIKTVFSKGIDWGLSGDNPASKVKKFKEESRDRFLKTGEFPRFIESLNQEPNTMIKNFFWILLFTGQRKTNVLEMQWNEIDFDRKVWRIPKTKNGTSLNVPLMDKAIEILLSLKEDNKSEWVFPSHGKTGHFQDPKNPWKRLLQRANITDLRIHDIRRTMGSYQAMTGASLPVIGKGLGHKTSQATEVYARLNDDPIREAFEKATDKMLNSKV